MRTHRFAACVAAALSMATPLAAQDGVVTGAGSAPVTRDLNAVRALSEDSAKADLVRALARQVLGEERLSELTPDLVQRLASQIRSGMIVDRSSLRVGQEFRTTLSARIDRAWFQQQLDDAGIRSSSDRGGAQGPRDSADFSEFFSSVFGKGEFRGAQSRQHKARGEDHHAAIEIAIEDAIKGVEREISLRAMELDAQGQPAYVNRTLSVKIPAGVHPGQFIRLAGQGMPGHGGEAAGDLYLEVRLAAHKLYRVDGSDLYMTLPVTPTEAALGAQVQVPTPSGGVVEVTIPANARSGLKLRLKDRGLPGKPPGHLYLLLEIALPPADSEAMREAYAQLAKAAPFDPRRHLNTSGA